LRNHALSVGQEAIPVQARPGVIDRLNTILTIELTAINQYFVQAEMCKNWGYERLYEKFHHSSLAEMKDTPGIIAHILYLEGVPNMQRLNQVRVGETVLENLNLDLQLEQEAVEALREAITHCQSVGDYTTRRMFEEMIASEEEHIDWIENQLEAIRQIGIELYLSQQLKDED
jgi:bacterioferritin